MFRSVRESEIAEVCLGGLSGGLSSKTLGGYTPQHKHILQLSLPYPYKDVRERSAQNEIAADSGRGKGDENPVC